LLYGPVDLDRRRRLAMSMLTFRQKNIPRARCRLSVATLSVSLLVITVRRME